MMQWAETTKDANMTDDYDDAACLTHKKINSRSFIGVQKNHE
jgi:hypothetical protein